jgi:hypothetical protein
MNIKQFPISELNCVLLPSCLYRKYRSADSGHWLVDWLIDYLRFYVPLKNFSLVWRRHHCRWRAAKFRPMLGAQGLWAGRDLCCDTGPRFFRSHPKDRPIQSPSTTHEGVWRIYSNPDPHGGLIEVTKGYRFSINTSRSMSSYSCSLSYLTATAVSVSCRIMGENQPRWVIISY